MKGSNCTLSTGPNSSSISSSVRGSAFAFDAGTGGAFWC
jgi:hypothetical protein